MALFISLGQLFTQQPGKRVTWVTTIGNFLDRRAMVQRPNIVDDLFAGPVSLAVVEEGVLASDAGLQYLVTIENRSPVAVSYNINAWDPL